MSNLTLRVSIAALLFPSVTAVADEVPNVVLDPIVITATRSPENVRNVPARVNVIGEAELQKNPSLNLSDVLQKDAGISVKQYGGIGQVPEVSLRGTSTKHTLFLKDEARLNNQNDLNPIYTGFLDTSDVERVEIVKGSASVQYGSDAIGGVVQLISQNPTRNKAFVTGIYGENNTYKAIVGADLVADNGLYAQIRGQKLETDGTRIFNTQPRNQKASYDQQGYGAKIGFDNQKNINTYVSISENEGVNIFSANNGISNIAPREFNNRIITTKTDIKPTDKINLGLRYSNIQDKQNVPAHASYYNTEGNEFDINGKWQFTQNQNILIGATHNQSEFQSNTVTNNSQDVKTTGYYVQHQYNSDKVNTQFGIRLEDNNRFGNYTVGQGAIRYHFTPNSSIYTNIGTAFRAPSLNELYTQWGGNDQLKPEESLSYELGFDHKFNNNLSGHLSAYQTNIDNLIVWNQGKNNNIGESEFNGGEIGIKYQQGDYYATANYAYTKTKNKTTGLEITYRPKNTGALTLGYDDGVYGVSTSMIARSKANANNSANPIKVAGYATMDLNAHWHINPHIKLFTNIQNIWNTEYKTVHNTLFDPVTYATVGENWYINGGRQANLGVTFSY